MRNENKQLELIHCTFQPLLAANNYKWCLNKNQKWIFGFCKILTRDNDVRVEPVFAWLIHILLMKAHLSRRPVTPWPWKSFDAVNPNDSIFLGLRHDTNTKRMWTKRKRKRRRNTKKHKVMFRVRKSGPGDTTGLIHTCQNIHSTGTGPCFGIAAFVYCFYSFCNSVQQPVSISVPLLNAERVMSHLVLALLSNWMPWIRVHAYVCLCLHEGWHTQTHAYMHAIHAYTHRHL